MTQNPSTQLKAKISSVSLFPMSLFKEEDPYEDTASEDYGANKVREQEREPVKDRAAREKFGITVTGLGQCSTKSWAENGP